MSEFLKSKPIKFYPIGFVRTKFKKPEDVSGVDKNAWLEIKEKYVEGLKELNGFSHIIVIFNFHKSEGFSLLVKPLKYNPKGKTCGVFATRAPYRPNPIGCSTVKVKSIENNRIYIYNRDMLDGTPILDIKPYLPEEIENPKFGWYVKNHYLSNTDSKS